MNATISTAAGGSWYSVAMNARFRDNRSSLAITSLARRFLQADYLNGGRWELVQEFVEVESGKHNERPQLEAALAARKYAINLP
jgi:hypothetical protein